NVGDFTPSRVDAIASYRKSFAMAEQAQNKLLMATALQRIASKYRQTPQFKLALEPLQRSLALLEAIGDKGQIVNTLHDLGHYHMELGNYSGARQYFQRALAAPRDAPDSEF